MQVKNNRCRCNFMAELFFIHLFLSKIIIIVQSFLYGNDLTIYSNLELHM
jgi:hypothetical protein